MASPRKKWHRLRLAELADQEVQEVEVQVQPEPVVDKVAEEPLRRAIKRTRKK